MTTFDRQIVRVAAALQLTATLGHPALQDAARHALEDFELAHTTVGGRKANQEHRITTTWDCGRWRVLWERVTETAPSMDSIEELESHDTPAAALIAHDRLVEEARNAD